MSAPERTFPAVEWANSKRGRTAQEPEYRVTATRHTSGVSVNGMTQAACFHYLCEQLLWVPF